jgi:hypothetical protein
MPISGLALSRTSRQFTDHLKNFELGTITETNPSDGVYRYTFADGTSPYTWAEVANAQAGIGASGLFAKFGINVGHVQMNNDTGATDIYTIDPNPLHGVVDEPKTDSIAANPSFTLLPSGRNTETSGTFASFLGGSAVTYGNNFSGYWGPFTDRILTNSPVTVSASGRYVEINWNQVALNETTYTTNQRQYGRTLAGKVKIVFQPFIYFDTLDDSDYAVYYGKPRYYNTTIAGTSLTTLRSSPPSDITSFNYPGGRVIGWTETNANFANPYIYLYKWTGSWTFVREGYISDGHANFIANGTKTANYNTYTVPVGDGSSTYFYIYIYQYDGYYNTFSGTGAASNFITV